METKNFVQSFDFLPKNAKRYAEIAFRKYGKDLLTVSETCDFLTLSRSTLHRKVKAGVIPSRPIANTLRFDIVELALIKSGEVLPAYIQPTAQPATQAAPKKQRGRIPASSNADELLAILNG